MDKHNSIGDMHFEKETDIQSVGRTFWQIVFKRKVKKKSGSSSRGVKSLWLLVSRSNVRFTDDKANGQNERNTHLDEWTSFGDKFWVTIVFEITVSQSPYTVCDGGDCICYKSYIIPWGKLHYILIVYVLSIFLVLGTVIFVMRVLLKKRQPRNEGNNEVAMNQINPGLVPPVRVDSDHGDHCRTPKATRHQTTLLDRPELEAEKRRGPDTGRAHSTNDVVQHKTYVWCQATWRRCPTDNEKLIRHLTAQRFHHNTTLTIPYWHYELRLYNLIPNKWLNIVRFLYRFWIELR